jgi:uncharacterized membrane protein YfcA
MDLVFVISGLLVGFVIGMSGVGGGSLMTPLLVMGFGVAPTTAVGTDLLYAGLTKAGGTVARGKLGSVDWRIAFVLMLGSVPAALATSGLLSRFAIKGAEVGTVVTSALGLMLVITALALVFRHRLLATQGRFGQRIEKLRSGNVPMLTLVLGAVLGVLVTLTSVGAGALGVVALLMLYPHLPTNHLAGTDIVHAVPLTLVAGAGHAITGSVDYQLLGNLLIGSLPGIVAGSMLAHRVPEKALRYVMGAVLFAVGVKLLS